MVVFATEALMARPPRPRPLTKVERISLVAQEAELLGEWWVEASFAMTDDWSVHSERLRKAAGRHPDHSGALLTKKPVRDMTWVVKSEASAKSLAKRLLRAARGLSKFRMRVATYEADRRGGIGLRAVAKGKSVVGWAGR